MLFINIIKIYGEDYNQNNKKFKKPKADTVVENNSKISDGSRLDNNNQSKIDIIFRSKTSRADNSRWISNQVNEKVDET